MGTIDASCGGQPGNRFRRFAASLCLGIGSALLAPLALPAGGLPEPDLVLYGIIRNTQGGLNVRLTVGTLNWVFQPASGGRPLTATASLTNLNDQLSYVMRVSCETPLPDSAVAEGFLALGTSYDRAVVTVDGHPASFAQANQQTLVLAGTDRGRFERVDLLVSIGGTGPLPDNWQLQYFGRTGIDPSADPDQDGLDNLGEYRAGTNPVDPGSVFGIEIAEDITGGPKLTWLSVAGRVYTLRRSEDLSSGFRDLAIDVAATPPFNRYQDTSVIGPGPYFYQVLVKPAGP